LCSVWNPRVIQVLTHKISTLYMLLNYNNYYYFERKWYETYASEHQGEAEIT